MAKPALFLVGYGRMGREVEQLAQERGFLVVGVASRSRPLEPAHLQAADVVVDFSVAEAVIGTARQVLAAGKRLVIGTTGWTAQRRELEELVARFHGGVVYSSNFALGVQLFVRIVQYAARLVAPFADFDIFVHELHHRHKRDAPSGTALRIAEAILQACPRKQRIVTAETGPLPPEALHLSFSRGGELIGTHVVYLDAASEGIELVHRAKHRRAFAAGALLAAEWIVHRQGLYEFGDVLEELLR
ncbi:4-hydroxy-tetrahydrodipicolinate reductase [bacterium HR21]|nr:4-hydroxy-tetrahydrodipicolinate reductase [bacterium HR21]